MNSRVRQNRLSRLRVPARCAGPLGVLLLTTSLALGDASVPAGLQAKLTGKLALFDRQFVSRAGARARVLVVVRPNDAGSAHFAETLTAALRQLDAIGGLPHEEVTMAYLGADSLAAAVREQHPAIVYLASGLAGEARAIGDALTGLDVLSVSAEPEAVPRGVVASFDLVSNQPKIVLNPRQAAKQRVQLTGTLLQLAILTEG